MGGEIVYFLGSTALAIGSLFSQATESRVSLPKGLFLFFLGFIHFIQFTSFLNKLMLETRLGHMFRQKYNLATSKILDTNNKFVSAIQAIYSLAAGLKMCTYSCNRNFLYTSHFISSAYAWFGSSYFLFDMWSMYRVHVSSLLDKMKATLKQDSKPRFISIKDIPSLGNGQLCILKSSDGNLPSFLHYLVFTNPLMVIHHIFIGCYGLLVITYFRGILGDCVFSFVYIMEASTPFVSFRSILGTMNLKSSRLYVVNGLAMLFSFFFVRVLALPYSIYWYSTYAQKSFVEALLTLRTHCKISMSLIFALQVYWFQLILKGAIKLFSKPSTTKVSSQ